MPGKPASPAAIYQLKITLRHISPPIWRRVQVPADIRLDALHRVIQDAMGWEDCHLHEFTGSGMDRWNIPRYGVPNPELLDEEVQDERRFRLNQLLTAPKQKLIYEYDFGDSWQHDVVLEKILPPDPEARYPLCVAGKRACPPEDVGGVWGYQAFCEAMADPAHEEHAQYAEWIGDEFDPAAFDLDAVNRQLQPRRQGRR
jgi:hypothetical protein